MFQALRQRKDEEGFTLIELMVVVLIIAILIAIAIPTFLGARNRANDRAAQSSLRNTLTSAKTIFTDKQDYTQATLALLKTVEPSLTFVLGTASSTLFKTVSVDPISASAWVAAALSKTNTCFFIGDNATSALASGLKPGTNYGMKTGSSKLKCIALKYVALSGGMVTDSNVGW